MLMSPDIYLAIISRINKQMRLTLMPSSAVEEQWTRKAFYDCVANLVNRQTNLASTSFGLPTHPMVKKSRKD